MWRKSRKEGRIERAERKEGRRFLQSEKDNRDLQAYLEKKKKRRGLFGRWADRVEKDEIY